MQEISQYQETSVGSYRLFQLVGVGPLSHAHLAERQDWPERKLVVKLFDMVPLHSLEEQDQVLDEVRLLTFLEHPSILPILDDGMRGETLYLVSPSIEAGSLRQRMTAAAGELLPLKETLAILRQVGEALHFAHTQQAVHANLKPENILVQDDGKVLLADFLLPTLVRSERAARMLSTFAAFYMAPEQFRGEATPASDQYALACLAYELLTGRPPFEADDFTGLVRKHATQQPQSPAELQPKRAGHIAHAILKALAKRPEERYPDIQAFLADLSAPPPLVSATPVPAPATLSPQTQEASAPTESPEPEPSASGVHEEATVLLPSVAASTPPESSSSRVSSVNGAPALAPGADLAPGAAGPVRARSAPRLSQRQIWVIGGLLCLALLVGFSGLFFFLTPAPSNRAQVHAGVPTATPGSLPSPTQTSAGATATATLVGITLQPSPTPAPRPSSTPAPGRSPTAPAFGCAVQYTISNQQPGSFTANLTITNTGSNPIQGWRLVFSFTAGQHIQRVLNGWSGHFTQKGAQVTMTNPGDNPTIAPGASVTLGFQGSWNGSNPAPSSFTLNGVTCQ